MGRKSETLGMEEAYSLNISPTFPLNIYKALIPLTCDNCRDIIQPEEIFSRSSNKLGTKPGIRYVFCVRCKPIK